MNQYGLLKNWKVGPNATYLDNEPISKFSIGELNLKDNCFISVKIGIKENAKNVGGVSLFGEHFGDYPQNIVLKIDYEIA